MKTRLLKRLRKRFDWKFVIYQERKTLVLYDKKYGLVFKNYNFHHELGKSDLECILNMFDNTAIMSKWWDKKQKLKFDKL